MKEVLIVGAGLFGSIAARLARARGHSVTVFDSGEEWAASKASGCVLAPSWLSSLSKEEVVEANAALESVAAPEPLLFQTNAKLTFKAARVDPKKLLVKPDVKELVTYVKNGKLGTVDQDYEGIVLVAAGLGCAGLIRDMPAMRGLWGASLAFAGQIAAPRIHVYAPYRQAVAFNIDKSTVWMGDGTALIEKTWIKEGPERVDQTILRARKLFGLKGTPRATIGARPYVEGHKAGYFAKVFPRTWVSTGGAKNGTVLAALQAQRFINEARL